MESRWSAADGHAIRRIDFAAPPADARKGSLLFLPGRGDAYEKYLETLAHWSGKGWQASAIDWRGQGGSGRLGADGVTGHIGDFAGWIGDLADFWAQWRSATPGPHVVVGHSMGGHLALRALAEKRIDPAALVLTAPMLGFRGTLPLAVTHVAARIMAAIGDHRRPAWKWSEKPGEPPASRIDLLTHDADRYADELWWRTQRPELVVGPGSWRWVERAHASMRGLFARGVLESIATPVLIVATKGDRLVSWGAIEDAARRLPHAQLAAFGEEARHEILREADPVRTRALGIIDTFLQRAIA